MRPTHVQTRVHAVNRVHAVGGRKGGREANTEAARHKSRFPIARPQVNPNRALKTDLCQNPELLHQASLVSRRGARKYRHQCMFESYTLKSCLVAFGCIHFIVPALERESLRVLWVQYLQLGRCGSCGFSCEVRLVGWTEIYSSQL